MHDTVQHKIMNTNGFFNFLGFSAWNEVGRLEQEVEEQKAEIERLKNMQVKAIVPALHREYSRKILPDNQNCSAQLRNMQNPSLRKLLMGIVKFFFSVALISIAFGLLSYGIVELLSKNIVTILFGGILLFFSWKIGKNGFRLFPNIF